MRYSLSTLILLVLWITFALIVWARREPWGLHSKVEQLGDPPPARRHVAPDGRYVASSGGRMSMSQLVLGIASPSEGIIAYIKPSYRNGELSAHFVDNDTIIMRETCRHYTTKGSATGGFTEWVYHRRYPEWWWGHYYRLELWIFFALSSALLLKFRDWLWKPEPSDSTSFMPATQSKIENQKSQIA